VRNVAFSLETGEKYRILVSLSGSPLFDIKGDFVGIVFSIEDITQRQMLQDQVKKYEDSSGMDIAQKIEQSFAKIKTSSLMSSSMEQFNLLQIAMLDMSVGLKNSIAEASLIASSLEHSSEDALLRQGLTVHLNQLLLNMNTLINGNISYYNDIYLYQELDFVKLLRKSITLFAYSFEQNSISVTNSLDNDFIIMANSKELVLFILRLMECILSLEVSSCELKLSDKILFVELHEKLYNEKAVEIFLSYYEAEHVNELFGGKIEIKSLNV